VGRPSASVPGFDYSPAMKQAHLTWTPETLDAYLADPQKVVPGNRMPFPGLKSAHDRQDVIAFLATDGGKNAAPATASAAPAPAPSAPPPAPQAAAPPAGAPAPQAAAPKAASAPPPASLAPMSMLAEVKYTLRSGIAEGRMVFIGIGGSIDGQVNPTLGAAVGQLVQVTLINGEGAEHDIVFPEQNAKSARVTGRGASTTIAFQVTKAGDFVYFCSVPGHREAGMEGKFAITEKPPAPTVAHYDIAHDPAGVPPPIGERGPQTVRVDLETVELEARLADSTTFTFWTFNRTVPGPFVRVRVGDTVDVHLKNAADSTMVHSVDFHAATGPGGGSAALQVGPGEEKSLSFKTLTPGLYVYHCATPMVAEHIANGMYGLILVEPEGGMPKVDHEFYIMQGEIYTDQPFGQQGSQEFSVTKLLDEHPEYVVFNGEVGALTKLHPLHAKVGDTVRIFFGDAGPNMTSSFHVIGEIFDRVYWDGGLSTPPQQGLQTITVPAGGAAVVDFKVEVPGRYTIVDHALARMERGLVGQLLVEGPDNPDVYRPSAPLSE
jgi:nitrite reductase (NO-forming)